VVVRTGRVQSQRRALTIPDIPFTRYEVTSTTTYPARTHGKVFFSRGDRNFVCSGTVVSSEVKSVVFSAAHCLFEDGTWSTNWTFVPGYRNGSSPYGRFPARRLVALNGWLNGENRNYDIGAAVLTTSSDGRAIQTIVGSRGYAFNQPRQQHFQDWGYPAAPPFDGQKSWVCESDYGGDDPTPPSTGPPELTIGCDFTGGSSGGGWIIAGQYLNSVNQGSYSSSPNVELGPYFGDGAKNLYNGVCCGDSPPPIDTTPPETVLTHGPPHQTRSRSAVFWFESSETGSTFECRLGNRAWSQCSAPKRYPFLGLGRHSFSVRAYDPAGNVDLTPASYQWRIG
jgi:V8-like Glu-specific endopeptidase